MDTLEARERASELCGCGDGGKGGRRALARGRGVVEGLQAMSQTEAAPAQKKKPAATGGGNVVATQRILVSRIAAVVLVVLMLTAHSSWSAAHPVWESVLVVVGLAGTGAACAGRLWCSVYIAGKKNRELVKVGPYSVCRNPLYFFSLVGAIGAALAGGMVTFAVVTAVVFVLAYRPVIEAEERYLEGVFGEEFAEYVRTVPRLMPKWGRLVHAEICQPSGRVFFQHAQSALWFPAAAGLLMLIQVLQRAEVLPVLIRLP